MDKRKQKSKSYPGRSDSNKAKRFEFKCFKCHEKGHKAIECTSKKVNDKLFTHVSLLSSDNRDNVCQMTDNADETIWYLDSIASLQGHKRIYRNRQEGDGQIEVGEQRICRNKSKRCC